MATSGAMSTTNTYIKYSIECIQNSQNVSANNSSVTVKVRVWRTNSGYTTYGTGTVYCKINGTTYSAAITSGQSITSSGVEIFNKTLTIGHNADGTKTLSMSAWITHDRFSSSEQAYNQVLSTIPRASSLKLSATTINAGASVTLTITRASSNFVHDAYFTFGKKTYSMGKSLGTSGTYTIPMDCLDQIPNATAGVGTVRLYTLSGGTIIGSVDVGVTINVPSSVVPTFSSLSIARVDNGVPSAWGLYVRGKSKATLTINGAAGTYGSTISKYVIEGGGYSGTSNKLTTGTLNDSGTNTFTATITDSRGRTATKTVTCSVVDYESPKINSFIAVRCNSAGTETDEGTYVKVTPNLTYSSVNSKNTLSAVVAYKTAAATSWSSNTTVTSGKSTIIGGGAISVNSSYQFRLTISDAFSSSVITVTVPTAATTLDFKKGGKGVAIGKVAENDGFEVDWTSTFNKNLVAKNGIICNMSYGPSVTINNTPSGLSVIERGDSGLSEGGFSTYPTILTVKHSPNRQFQIGANNKGTTMAFRSGHVYNTDGTAEGWSSWKELYHTGHKPTASELSMVAFDYANETTSSPHPRIYVPGKEWLRAPSGGFVPYKHQSGYLGLSNKAWYDFHTVHINSKPCRGSGGRWWNCMVDVGNDGVTEIGKYIDFHDSSTTTADYNVRLTASGSTLNCSGSFTQGSDRAFKEDIHYFDEAKMLTRSSMSESTIFKDFIRDVFRPCTFRYKDTEEVVTGFIAQDIIDTDIGKLFVRQVTVDTIDKNGEGTSEVISQDNRLVFDLSGYTTIIAKALQEEIREKDEKIKDLEERLSKLEQLILK